MSSASSTLSMPAVLSTIREEVLPIFCKNLRTLKPTKNIKWPTGESGKQLSSMFVNFQQLTLLDRYRTKCSTTPDLIHIIYSISTIC